MLQPTVAVSTAILLSISILSPQLPQNENPENNISQLTISDARRDVSLDNPTSEDNTKSSDETESPRGETGKTPSAPESKHTDSVTSPGISLWLKMESDNSRKILQNFRLPTCRITQSEDSHNTKEGWHSFALDMACIQGVSYDVRAPDFKLRYDIVYKWVDSRLWDYIVLRNWDERWIFWHTQSERRVWESVTPGDVIGQSNDSGHSQGIHTHAEYWKGSKNMTFDGKRTNEFSQKLCIQREWQFCQAKKVEAKTPTKSTTPTKKSKVTCRADKAQDMVQYAYDLGGIDFVGTISAESKFDPHAVWDSGKSYGYCQIHRDWNPETQNEYRALTTNKERMDFCHKIYQWYIEKGNIANRLYGYRVRYTKWLPKLNIKCQ